MRSDTSPVLAFLEQQRGVANDYSVSAAYDQRVWVQDLDRIDQCTALEYRGIVLDDCQSRHGFICEIGKTWYFIELNYKESFRLIECGM